MGKRIKREERTMEAMIKTFCKKKHLGTMKGHRGVCNECSELLEYALGRLAKCRFGDQKPTCRNCPIHCYAPHRREQVRAVMRFSGPRMIFHHPALAFRHLVDS
ncbi:MAG: hypothetical protein Kow0069_04860 [Promethearchaeota archaeon]